MRVGIVCPYSFDVHGGVQNHVRDLAEALLGLGHDVAVLAPGERTGRLPAYVTTTGRSLAMPYNGSVARVAFGPLVAGRVRRWLAEGRFDVLHIHEPATPSVSVLALWAATCPVVATFHTAQERSRALETSAATFLRSGLGKIGGHIAVSEEARATMGRYLAVDPVVIPNGVDTGRFALPRGRTDGPVLAFVGRLDEPRKGFQLLLDALPAVVDRHPGVRLVVVGHGGRRRMLRGLPAEVAARVELRGRLPDEEKATVLAEADVVVAPNTHGESFGIVLVEAMAAGAAVVASDLPAFLGVLEGGRLGALFAAGDATELAGTVNDLLDDPARRRRIARRASQAVAGYDWASVAPRVADVYAAVVAEELRTAAG
jgi:phosphatidyl-myo-inositol alpha-mannosyltransferase